MSRRSFTAVLSAMLVLALSLSACSSPTKAPSSAPAPAPVAEEKKPEAKKPAGTGTLVVGRAGDSVGFDPANTTDSESSVILLQVMETLVDNHKETLDIVPALAEKWEILDGGKTYLFHLRKNVKFHDGEPFNADAVVFNFDRWMNEKNPHRGTGTYFWYKLFFGGFPGIVESVKALDPQTVELKLSKPYAPLLSTISGYGFAIVSPKAIKEKGADIAKHPVGTGAYKFVEWVKDDRVVIERYAEYWGEPAQNEKVIFRPMPDAQSRAFALQAGQINLLRNLHPDHIPQVNADPNSKVVMQASLGFAYLAFNTNKAPWNDVRVRKAVAYALDKKSLVDTVGSGIAVEGKLPYPPAYWGYHEGLKDYEHNLAEAKRLLAEAGFPEGFKTTLWAMPIARDYIPEPRKTAEVLQADLAKVGIQAEIVSYDWGTYLEKLTKGEQDMFLLGLSSLSADPDFHLRFTFDGKGGGRTFYKSDRYASLMEQGLTEQDQTKRVQIYKQVQEVLMDEVPVITLYHIDTPHAVAKNLDFLPHPLGMRFRWVSFGN